MEQVLDIKRIPLTLLGEYNEQIKAIEVNGARYEIDGDIAINDVITELDVPANAVFDLVGDVLQVVTHDVGTKGL